MHPRRVSHPSRVESAKTGSRGRSGAGRTTHLLRIGGGCQTSAMATSDDLPQRVFGWSNMFVPDGEDPRSDGGWDNSERSVLLGFLADRRLTLEMKCVGLDPKQLTNRSVPPSDMSLLGLVRHLTGVERHWFQHVIAGNDITRPYRGPDGENLEFVVSPDPTMVDETWAAWQAETSRSDHVVAAIDDFGQLGLGRPVPFREVIVHMIREYAQHLGHADFLRERIDGHVGQ